jgi:DNA polymerase (family X)
LAGMQKPDASAVAKLLIEFGKRTELSGGNPYRARAYYRAAESLLALTLPLDDVVAQGRLREIPGVGDVIADIIGKLHATGTHPRLETMRREAPAGLLDLLNVPGLRADKALKIYKLLGVSTLEELEEAAREDRLKTIKGLGPALQAKILRGIEIMRHSHGRRHLHRAADLLAAAEKNLRQSHPELARITPAGSFRRGCELVDDLSLVAEIARGEPARLDGEISVYLSDPGHYGVTLLFATGSVEHLQKLQALAAARGFMLDENGLQRNGRRIVCKDEDDVYTALGLPFIAPELREGLGEIELASAKRLPELVTAGDVRGILHAHTVMSDGGHTLQQMAEATRTRGYGYFGVADHSRSAHYAGGLTLDEVAAQHALADELNDAYGDKFRVFKGIESDILSDGSLDYPDDVLSRFNFVVASVHSQFRLDRKAQTARIIRAVSNPSTTILGHMTGRQLLRRPGYDVDVEEILRACAAHGVAVEINANPWRLDLDWRWHRRALELGCTMSINPDAHTIGELDLIRWGLVMARKGGVPKEKVLNCLDLAAITRHFEERKRHARRRAARPARRLRQSAAKPPRRVGQRRKLAG